MDYSVEELIGMLNLGIILARGKSSDKVEIPQNAAVEINVYLKTLKEMENAIKEP